MLLKCYECGHAVSTGAKACPNCGANPPAVPTKPPAPAWTQLLLMVLIGVPIVAVVIAVGKPDDPQVVAQREAACRQDLQCWGSRGISASAIACGTQVEKLARHSVRWASGDKFTHFRWKDKERGMVTIIGDRAEFQNGFGAYTPVTYECDLGEDHKAVLDVRVSEGRLP